MSNQLIIEKLLAGGEVSWMPLESIARKISSGGTPSTGVAAYYDGDIPWLRTQEVDFKDVWDTSVKITQEGLENSSAKWIPANCVIVAMYGATVGKVAINKIPLTTNQASANIELDEAIANYRYVFHYIASKYEYIKSLGAGTQTNINAGVVRKLPIPIPCPSDPKKSLEIQGEIVRILDAFTELTAELTARKKQYNYYRDQLLRFDDGDVEWKTLGEVTSPTSNLRWRNSNESYLYIDLTSVSRENNSIVETVEITSSTAPSRAQKLVEKDDVIFATTRPTQLRICRISDRYSGAVASTGYCVLRAKKSVVLPSWIYFHLSSSRFHKYVEENQSGSAYPAISDALVKKFALPFPYPDDPERSLAEQTRIVSILDKFDALTNSISEGLPREIELRQKQYEYYRDLLLSFPKPEEVEA